MRWTTLYKMSSVLRHFQALKGAVAFILDQRPHTILSEYFSICDEYVCATFDLHFVLSFPLETIVSSVHVTAAIIIRRGVSCTLRATFSVPHNFHHRIPSRQRCCHHHLHRQTISLHEYTRYLLHYLGLSNPWLLSDTKVALVKADGRALPLRYQLPNTTKLNAIRNEKDTPQASKGAR